MWDTKYRPRRFSEVLGQRGTVKILQTRLRGGSALDKSYIFAGGHGQGKCVRGDTLVPTNRGLVPIRSLMGTHQIDPLQVTVVQAEGISTSAYSYQGGERETICIRTHLGFELEGTHNHRIQVMQTDGSVGWRRLDEIQRGDYACIVRRGIFGEGADISGWVYDPKHGERRSVPFDPPSFLSEDWGRLMGYMIGDGTCTPREVVLISCAEADVKDDILALLRALGGVASSTPDKRRPGLCSLRCHRVQFRSFLSHLGVGYVGAASKTIPWAVLASPEPVVRGFLRGYFESDGSVSGHQVEAVTKSPELARQLQVLLLQFGVVARRFPKQHPKYGQFWRLRVSGASVKNFAERIGFISVRKQKALDALVHQAHAQGRRKMTNIYDVVPHQTQRMVHFYGKLSKRTRETSHFFRCRRGLIACTGRQIEEIATKYADPYIPNGAAHFSTLHRMNYVYDPIVGISKGKCEVYDLNVPQGEMFAANGFMNHNTTLARILARALLCLNLDKENPEPCNECDNCLEILGETSLAFQERDATTSGNVEHIRALVEELPFAVFGASKRIHLFDEAHRMSRDAQDVLLKPLEEKRLVGIFCTTEPEKIRGTIRSRCEDYTVRKVTREDILVRMKTILETEGVTYEDDGVLTVIDYSGGHVRDVLNRMEMVAQMGGVTLANVREYLQLSVVSTFYEILLSLGSPQRAIELVEQACERVSPQEVADGIAEAAMNSYRMANGMFAEFVYVDRALGQKVYEAFGASTLRLSEFFLSRRQTTKINLFCDILNMVGGVPAATAAAPVMIAAPVQVVLAPQVPAVPSVPVPSQQASASIPPPAPVPTPQAPEKKSEEKKVSSGTRLDGVGSLGSSDVLALTEVDHKGVPQQKARGREQVRVPVSFPRRGNDADDSRILTPEEWRREFERTWQLGRG